MYRQCWREVPPGSNYCKGDDDDVDEGGSLEYKQTQPAYILGQLPHSLTLAIELK